MVESESWGDRKQLCVFMAGPYLGEFLVGKWHALAPARLLGPLGVRVEVGARDEQVVHGVRASRRSSRPLSVLDGPSASASLAGSSTAPWPPGAELSSAVNHAGFTYSPMVRTRCLLLCPDSVGRACAWRVQVVKAPEADRSVWVVDKPVGLEVQLAPPSRLLVPARVTVRPAHAKPGLHATGARGQLHAHGAWHLKVAASGRESMSFMACRRALVSWPMGV